MTNITIRDQMKKMEPEFANALPAHITVERFMRIALTAINSAPALLAANRNSLFAACMACAQDGLIPDGREATLTVFNAQLKGGGWEKRAVYMPMIGGIIKKVRNSGELSAISANVVYENDLFDYELGDTEHISHKPTLKDRGEAIGVYAIAHLKNGMIEREVMSVEEVETVRAVSRAANDGPWVNWWGEMARKTVIRRLSKRLPMSTDIERVMYRDDDLYDLSKPEPVQRLAVPEPAQQDPLPGQEEAEAAISQRETQGAAKPAVAYDLVDQHGVVIHTYTRAGDYLNALQKMVRANPDAAYTTVEANIAAMTVIAALGDDFLRRVDAIRLAAIPNQLRREGQGEDPAEPLAEPAPANNMGESEPPSDTETVPATFGRLPAKGDLGAGDGRGPEPQDEGGDQSPAPPPSAGAFD